MPSPSCLPLHHADARRVRIWVPYAVMQSRTLKNRLDTDKAATAGKGERKTRWALKVFAPWRAPWPAWPRCGSAKAAAVNRPPRSLPTA